MRSGSRLVLLMLGVGVAVATLRTICVPVGSFRAGLDALRWEMPSDSVRAILGDPNWICTVPAVDHLDVRAPDSAAVRAALRATTGERWVYSRSEPRNPAPRVSDAGCRAPIMATELGFDRQRRLRWLVREMQQTPVQLDPAITARR